MDIDFGYGSVGISNTAETDNKDANNNQLTDISTGKIDHDSNGVPADDIDDNKDNGVDVNNNNGDESSDKNGNQNDGKSDASLEVGTVVETKDGKYTVDDKGNLVDDKGNIFKEAKDVDEWLKGFEEVEDGKTISIDSVREAIGVEITDENDKPIEFDNTPEGVKAYVEAVLETSKEEIQEAAINTLYQRYPILSDVLNYYIANGNSLEGFGEIPDRSWITIDDSNEAQQEIIIRTAWREQGRKGDVESYIQYLKSSGTLYASAKEELAALQEANARYRKELEEEAERRENERIQSIQNYWNGVHEVIKSRQIAGYQIPESIIVNRNGQKLSVTPDDFFNYIYRVDQEGHSAYERDLAKQTPESRRDDEILRAYLMFVGGNYSNLVNMAINKEKVNTLKLRAKERNSSTVRVTRPDTTKKNNSNIDLGYN